VARYRGISTSSATTAPHRDQNAYTGEPGKTKNVLTGESGVMGQGRARLQGARREVVIVGDANYGEGSSREHAGSPAPARRRRGHRAQLSARIHESNLKKEGLLALTFRDPADYDRIREDDRINLIGLRDLAPGKPVECRIAHADGTTEISSSRHTFAASQLEWFRRGSALNLFHRV